MPNASVPAAAEGVPTTFLPLTPSIRRHLEQTVEGILALLDALDGEPDLEDGADDEPSLGWTSHGPAAGGAHFDDREAEDEHNEDGGDTELTLGAPACAAASFNLFGYEPSGFLQWTGQASQAHWGEGPTAASYDEREDENEHGGDILDQPHDDDDPAEDSDADEDDDPGEAGGDDEPSLGQSCDGSLYGYDLEGDDCDLEDDATAEDDQRDLPAEQVCGESAIASVTYQGEGTAFVSVVAT